MKYVIWFLMVVGWLMGLVYAKGIETLAALLIAPYAWYLAVKHLMIMWGMV